MAFPTSSGDSVEMDRLSIVFSDDKSTHHASQVDPRSLDDPATASVSTKSILAQLWPSYLSVFFIFAVTLSIFPAIIGYSLCCFTSVSSDRRMESASFLSSDGWYTTYLIVLAM